MTLRDNIHTSNHFVHEFDFENITLIGYIGVISQYFSCHISYELQWRF